MTALYRTVRHTGRDGPPCAICSEPVKVETAKTDANGHAVHDECYLKKVSAKTPAKAEARNA